MFLGESLKFYKGGGDISQTCVDISQTMYGDFHKLFMGMFPKLFVGIFHKLFLVIFTNYLW